MKYWRNLIISADQFVNSIFGGSCDETLSARAYREDWMVQHLINALFFDRNHCISAFFSEKYGLQLPEEYRKDK